MKKMGRGKMPVITLALPREYLARLDRVRGLAPRAAVIREAILQFVAREEVRRLEEASREASRQK